MPLKFSYLSENINIKKSSYIRKINELTGNSVHAGVVAYCVVNSQFIWLCQGDSPERRKSNSVFRVILILPSRA